MPTHSPTITNQCHDISKTVITILGRRIAKINPHTDNKNQNDILWLSDSPMTRKATKRAIIIAPAKRPNPPSNQSAPTEPYWCLTDSDMTIKGPKVHYSRTGTAHEILQSLAHDYL